MIYAQSYATVNDLRTFNVNYIKISCSLGWWIKWKLSNRNYNAYQREKCIYCSVYPTEGEGALQWIATNTLKQTSMLSKILLSMFFMINYTFRYVCTDICVRTIYNSLHAMWQKLWSRWSLISCHSNQPNVPII